MTVVVREDGAEHAVRSRRVAKMIQYLAAEERRIGTLAKGTLVFHFAGADGLTCEVTEKADLRSR